MAIGVEFWLGLRDGWIFEEHVDMKCTSFASSVYGHKVRFFLVIII